MRLKHTLMTLTLGAGALLLSAGTVWSAEIWDAAQRTAAGRAPTEHAAQCKPTAQNWPANSAEVQAGL